ncbi:MAG: MOSC domain-containing protein [Longimicrobiales bacterium]
MNGEVVSVHLADRAMARPVEVAEARAVPGKGLEGDRYFNQAGTFSAKDNPDRELTLIEIEAIEAASHDCGVTLEPGDARRQVVTRGVPLNHLVGREFWVGDVRVRGIRLCEPCEHLNSLTDPGVTKAFAHRGGLRAQILSEGLIRKGAEVRV